MGSVACSVCSYGFVWLLYRMFQLVGCVSLLPRVHAMLCYVVLYCVVICYAVLCYGLAPQKATALCGKELLDKVCSWASVGLHWKLMWQLRFWFIVGQPCFSAIGSVLEAKQGVV